jgi:hypothetical protein
MFSKIYYGITYYFSELAYFVELHVKNMTPAKYSYVLIGVFLFGWVLMRNQKK